MIKTMEKSNNVYRSRAKMLLDNFLGGVVWSFGVWVGTALIAVIIIYFLSKVDLVPIVGNFVSEVTKYMAKDRSFLPF